MDVLDGENSNDGSGKVKEKVRVVSLEDPSIIASDFSGNSNASVWSLCGLNSDDHDVELGDISPSISPIFTEQQMADHLRERLMVDDQLFSANNTNDDSALNSRPLPDFIHSDLELLDREMKKFENDGTGKDLKPKMEQDLITNDAKVASKRSPRKRVNDTIFENEGSGIALRTRNRRRGAQCSDLKASINSGKDVKYEITTRDEGILHQRYSLLCASQCHMCLLLLQPPPPSDVSQCQMFRFYLLREVSWMVMGTAR